MENGERNNLLKEIKMRIIRKQFRIHPSQTSWEDVILNTKNRNKELRLKDTEQIGQ